MADEPKKKTPSPKVIAAYMIREMFANVGNFKAEDLTSLVGSRVKEDKRTKVMAQFDKITAKLKARMDGVIGKHENPAPKGAKPAGKPPGKKK